MVFGRWLDYFHSPSSPEIIPAAMRIPMTRLLNCPIKIVAGRMGFASPSSLRPSCLSLSFASTAVSQFLSDWTRLSTSFTASACHAVGFVALIALSMVKHMSDNGDNDAGEEKQVDERA